MTRAAIATLLLAAGLAAGCATSAGPQEAEPALEPAAAPAPSVDPVPPPAAETPTSDQFLSLLGGRAPDALKNVLEVRSYSFAPADPETGPAEVRCEFFNVQGDRALLFEVRTLFFREDGTLVDATAWTPAETAARRLFRYRAVASTPRAASGQVQLRLLSPTAEGGS